MIAATARRLRDRARVWLSVRGGWFAERAGTRDYLRHPQWREGWGGPLNGQQFRRRMVEELCGEIAFVAIVETGTHRGATTAYLRRTTALPVHSFELNPRNYGFARAALGSADDVSLRRCDSRDGLRALGAAGVLSRGPVFFYLDAHGLGDLPLADELQLIFAHCRAAVVMVDDFAVPDDPGYAYDHYGYGQVLALEYLEAHQLRPAGVWFPNCRASEESGARRGSVVLADDADLGKQIDQLPSLRRWCA